MHGIFNHVGSSIHGFPVAFLRPGGTVQLYFSVPAELYTVFSDLNNLGKNPSQKSDQKSGQQSGQHFKKSIKVCP